MAESDSERAPRRAGRAFALFTVAMVAVMIFPLFALGNAVQPMVLGLPLSMAWVVGWIAVEFFVLIGFFLYEHGIGGE